MQTLKHIQTQIDALPVKYIFCTNKEIRYLPEILAEDEQILALTSGYMQGSTWLAVCTDRRVIFLDRGMFYGMRQLQMNLDKIQSIDSGYTLIFGLIRVWDGATSMTISLVLKSSIAHFVNTVQHAMDTYKRKMVHDIVKSAQTIEMKKDTSLKHNDDDSFITELERLSHLQESGALTLEEFVAAKQKLLAKK